MKERPIIFSGDMVQAILDGRKTQTRRVVKGKWSWAIEDADNCSDRKWPGYMDEYGDWVQMKCPYGKIGDRLWVRESYWEGIGVFTDPSGEAVSYWTRKRQYAEERDKPGPWSEPYIRNVPWMLKRPSIHMPRRASRITLEITGLRVERLQDISEEDARAEGVQEVAVLPGDRGSFIPGFWFRWEEIHGEKSWHENPWVWVIEFRRVNP